LATSQAVAVSNGLLASLPLHALTSFLPKLSPVNVVVPSILYDADAVIESVYFPLSGMISLVVEMAGGNKAEVGIIGREGMLGMDSVRGRGGNSLALTV
jgi:CRP-like cAMP-binding protein